MKASAFADIENLDRNFKNDPVADGLCWIDAFDPRIAFRGHGWPQEARAARSFRRFPDRGVDELSPAVQTLSFCPASVFLSFYSNTTEIAVRVCNADTTLMNHMARTGSAGVELYVRDGRDWVPLAVAVPPGDHRMFERRLISDVAPRRREYRLYLPLYKALEELSLGFAPGATVEAAPSPASARPIVFYGTSVTQGGCANTSGSDFVSLTGQMLDVDTINLGFSGNGRGEPEVAQLISEIDAEMFVLNYASNCDVERLRQTLPGFHRILRDAHPDTPIVLLGSDAWNVMTWSAEKRRLLTERRDIQMRFYLDTKAAGDRNLHWIDGEGILPPRIAGSFVDGVHPTSAGFMLMAERLAPHLAMIRHWEAERLHGGGCQ